MSAKNKLLIFILMAVLLFIEIRVSFYYRSQYLSARHQLRQQQMQVNILKVRLSDAANLDKKYVLQLQKAKESVSELERDVATGQRRLQLAATCRTTAGAASVADAATPGLNDAAKRHYFTLRERAETARIQIAGLQEYILQQCQP